MNTLIQDTLRLEPQRVDHAAEMFEVLSDPAIYEFENQPPESLAWLQNRFARLESRRSPDGAEHWLNWVVRLPTGELAGYVQATVVPPAAAFVAYELASRYWRRGIGSAAVRIVLEELQANYGVRLFAAVFKARNFRSRALLRSLGFSAVPPGEASAAPCEPDEEVWYRS
jgi:ribosomal-protein-alanine N-acetyltransferase